MELDRKTLLTALQTIEPALSKRELLPLLRMIWFTGSTVQATDGTIGIEAPLETDFTGGVPGAVLVGFIDSLTYEKVQTTVTNKGATFTCAKTKISLPLEPAERNVWPFTRDEEAVKITIPLDEKWKQALAFTMLSITSISVHEERRGITFAKSVTGVELYSTDSASLAWASMEAYFDWGDAPKKAYAPGEFIKETLKLQDTPSLDIYEKMFRAWNNSGINIYSKFLEVSEPINYARTLDGLLADVNLVPMPDGLSEALKRVELLKDNKDGIPAKLYSKDGILFVEGSSSFGDFREELLIENDNLEGAARQFTPEILLRALNEDRKTFALSSRCVVLRGPDNLTYLCSAHRTPEE